MKYSRKTSIVIVALSILMLVGASANATHIAGGQITYRDLGNRTIEYTFIGYRDADGVLFGQGLFDFGDGDFYGDEDGEVFDWEFEDLGNGIERWEFKLTHTYSGLATYLASYSEDFRTSNVQNVSGSVATRFYVDALVILDPLFENSSPKPLFPPAFLAFSGHKFAASFAMDDEDGDSLSFSLIVPKQAEGLDVNAYRLPSSPEFNNGLTDAEFSIDRLKGDLLWDAPSTVGLYSFAVKVEEW
ncbi:MAG: hypothetical protein AAF391_13450, partial [Bacteroidota bacterium]